MAETTDAATPAMETIEFTTPEATKRQEVYTPVEICGQEMTARKPKDATFFFAQGAMAPSARDVERIYALMRIVESSLDEEDYYRLLDMACRGEVTMGSVQEMVEQLLQRWSEDSKIPPDVKVAVGPHPDTAPDNAPVRVVNEDLDLDLECTPPVDLIMHIMASSIAASDRDAQQMWASRLFLDACLSERDARILRDRLDDHRDDMDLAEMVGLVRTLMERWYPEEVAEAESRQNRAQRRAKKSRERRSKSRGKAPQGGRRAKPRQGPGARGGESAPFSEGEDG